MENLNDYSVNQVQNLMNKDLVTDEQVDAYILAWNADSHFTTLKRLGQNLIMWDGIYQRRF